MPCLPMLGLLATGLYCTWSVLCSSEVSPNKPYHLLVLTFKPITNHLLPHILYANQPLTESLLVSLVDHVVHNLCASSGELCFFSPSPPGGLLRVLIGRYLFCMSSRSGENLFLLYPTYCPYLLFLCLPLGLIVPAGQRVGLNHLYCLSVNLVPGPYYVLSKGY